MPEKIGTGFASRRTPRRFTKELAIQTANKKGMGKGKILLQTLRSVFQLCAIIDGVELSPAL
ncbi:MAG: hypothetical protein MR727_13190 [Lentisphaeria bacterium]|nr:hypothetical protein [Lentisphaeria bacterium]